MTSGATTNIYIHFTQRPELRAEVMRMTPTAMSAEGSACVSFGDTSAFLTVDQMKALGQSIQEYLEVVAAETGRLCKDCAGTLPEDGEMQHEPNCPFLLSKLVGVCDVCGGPGRKIPNGGAVCETCHDAWREANPREAVQ